MKAVLIASPYSTRNYLELLEPQANYAKKAPFKVEKGEKVLSKYSKVFLELTDDEMDELMESMNYND